jgi:phosphopentomutase
MKRAILLVLDSFGVGAAQDADQFGDVGANTLLHIAQYCAKERGEQLSLPHLNRLGLGRAALASGGEAVPGLDVDVEPVGVYGYAKELSSGKDTSSGHWEIAGVPVLFDWGYFSDQENSFPKPLLDELVRRAELPGYLGNCHASGTEILERLGEEHVATGKPIFYTSSDSVFQIAAHEESFGLERLLALSELARELVDEYNIGRVIARPFIGQSKADYARTGNRRDYSVLPPAPTLLDKLKESGGEVVSVGKIADIYAHQGISRKVKATGIEALFDATLAQMDMPRDNQLIFTNFVDFDSAYGHRRDVAGYASALEYFDQRLPELLAKMNAGDVLIITADHGCDPTWPGTDHTREHIPVLMYGPSLSTKDLGLRDSFSDIGQSLANYFNLEALAYGTIFLDTAQPST